MSVAGIRVNVDDWLANPAARALSYQAKGDLDHAIADYTTVIRLKPDHANGPPSLWHRCP